MFGMLEEGFLLLACLALQRTQGHGISLTYKGNKINVKKSLKLCTSRIPHRSVALLGVLATAFGASGSFPQLA